MKKQTKLLSVLVVVCMLAVLMAACASPDADQGNEPAQPGDSVQTEADPTEAPSEAAAPPEELEDMSTDVIDADLTATISLGNWPADTAPEAERTVWEGYRAVYAQQYPNVEVIPAYFSYTLSNYVPMALGGTAPTVFQPPFTDPQLLIDQGLAGDVTDALAQFGLLEKFSPAYTEMLGDENGRIYGLPRDGYVLGMHINIELFEEAGLMTDDGLPMYPRTLQELAEYGQIIREKTGKAGLVFPASETFGGWLFTNIAWNFGAVGENALEIQDEDGRWIANFTSDAAIAAMQYIYDLQWEYNVFNADATTTNWAGAHSILGSGQAAMNFAANDAVENPTAGSGLAVDKFALVPFPAGPEGAYALTGGTCFMFAPNTTTDEAVAALGFIRLTGMLPFLDDDIVAGMRAGSAAMRERGGPVLPPIPAWNDEEYIAMQREIAEEYSNVDWRLYEDFFNSLTDGSITLRAEEPVFAQQLYRDLTRVIARVITREDVDIVASMENIEAEFQQYLDDEMNR